MQLNLDILAAWLPKDWHVRQLGAASHDLTLARLRLYEPEGNISADILYLTRAELLPAVPPDAACGFVCIGRQIPKSYTSAEVPVLQLPDKLSLAEVYNRVQDIYDKFDVWDARLRDELEKMWILISAVFFCLPPIFFVAASL